MFDEDSKKNENAPNIIINKNSNNIYISKGPKQNGIIKNIHKNRVNKAQKLSNAIKNIEINSINSIRSSQQLSLSSNKEQNSRRPMNININEISKHKRLNKGKKDSIFHNYSNINTKIEENKEQSEEGELTFRQRLSRFLEINNRNFYIKLSICILSFISFIYYIICTYINSLFDSLNYADYFVCTIYLIEHLINIILAHHFFSYIISIDSLISFLLELPPFFVFLTEDNNLDLLYRTINMTRVLRLLKGYKIVKLLQNDEKNINNQILYIIITLIIMVLIWAGIIQMSDLGYVTRNLNITFGTLERHNLLLRKQFHHYIYFSLISLTTVGYGEIIPDTTLARSMIVLMVIIILVVVPEQTNEIINLSNAQNIYERRKYISSPDIPYVVILGDIDLITLKNFCEEYFHADHGERYRHIIILMNKPPNRNIELFLNRKNNSKFIIYLQGDPMNYENLFRADILNAKSCIIFTKKNMMNKENGDQQTLLLAIFIKKFYYHTTLENHFANNLIDFIDPSLSEKDFRKKIKHIFKKNKKNNFKLCLQLNKSESSNCYFSTLQKNYQKNMISDKLLIIESLKMNLLSKSCITPGIISLISNLLISSIGENDKIFKNQPQWTKEYKEGQQYEIYKYKNIQGDLLFYSYQQLTQEIYNKFHCIIIALEINYHGGTLVKLNPQSKEKLIDILYSFLSIKSKNPSVNEEVVHKLNDQPDSTLLGDYNKEMETEIEENNIKKNNINFKKVRINIYLISKGRDILDDIKKLDEGNKSHNPNFNKNIFNSSNNLNFNIKNNDLQQTPNKEPKFRKSGTIVSFTNKNLRSSSLIRTKTHNNQNYSSDSDSSLSEEIDGNESSRFLINQNNINKIDEEDYSNNYYLMNENDKNYVFTNEIMRQGINDSNDIKHHIVICGMHQEIVHFILPLRNKYLPEKLLKWIVILAPFLPQEIHRILCKFPKIIFIKGDPLFSENLFRANISSADIAVILSSSSIYNNKQNNNIDLSEAIERENYNNTLNSNSFNKINLDAKTIFIYKSIKKLNKSIQIITELLRTNNIEFLLSSKHLIKLYKNSNENKEYIQNNKSKINDENEENIKEYLLYELTPVFAAGEVYLPSLIDKITAQIFYNSNILSILNLLLIGEKPPEKHSDKKLAQMLDLKGTNLFLIPCEPRNESFSDMFLRLLNKYNMVSIALYRKNIQENFYYVYTNPRKTTLIRESDMVFVLSSTENIKNIYEKNLVDITSSKNEKPTVSFQNNNSDNPSIFKTLVDCVEKEIKDKYNNQKYLPTKKNNNDSVKTSNIIKNQRKKRDSVIRMNNRNVFKEEEKDKSVKKGKYQEIENIQIKLDKIINILKEINNKYNDINDNIDNFVKEEIVNEMQFYIDKNKK